MTNEVRLPIETVHEGEKTTKVCVEDIYKILNRIIEPLNKAYNKSVELIDSVDKKYWQGNTLWEGSLIVGTGVSCPCQGDVYNEETGNDIAFMKAKLNANIKKWNLLAQIWNENLKVRDALFIELAKIQGNIERDLVGVREYNEKYLEGIEYTLGLFSSSCDNA